MLRTLVEEVDGKDLRESVEYLYCSSHIILKQRAWHVHIQGLRVTASEIWKGSVKRLVRAGVLRVPVRYDKPIVHGKPIIHVVLHWSHCNRGMFFVLSSQGCIPFPVWSMENMQRKWPHSIG